MAYKGKAGGSESAWVDRDMDDHQDRTVWRARCCPDTETTHCSKQSWTRANCYSYESDEVCREYVKRHLMGGARHTKTADEADDLALLCEIDAQTETYEDREAYRIGVESIHTEKQRRDDQWSKDMDAQNKRARIETAHPPIGPPKQPIGAPPERASTGAASSGELAQAVQGLTAIATAMVSASANQRASTGPRLGAIGGADIVINASNRDHQLAIPGRSSIGMAGSPQEVAHAFTVSCDRAIDAFSNACTTLISTVRTCNEEATRLKMLRDQTRDSLGML